MVSKDSAAWARFELDPGASWERGYFTVPADIPHERVMSNGYKYVRRFGDHLEKQGFTVVFMSEPERAPHQGGLNGVLYRMNHEDRQVYRLYARCRRRPVETLIHVPDDKVDEVLAIHPDLKLKNGPKLY